MTGRTPRSRRLGVVRPGEARPRPRPAVDPDIVEHRGKVLAVIGSTLVLVGVAARFFTVSPLWLDEALSVNIAGLPLGDIPDALRRDGHPPLYYFMLHGWTQVFGTSDLAVRAMSGVASAAALPLAYIAGRRLGGRWLGLVAMLVLALNPFAVRYGSEARMYALATTLAFAGIVLVDRALESPTVRRLAPVTLVSGALLLTHYWAMWLVGATIVLLVGLAVRARGEARSALVRTTVATAAGGVLFLPWVGVLLHQSQHTGTPWGEVARPLGIAVNTVVAFAGGAYGETQTLAFLMVVLVVIGIFGRTVSDTAIQLDFRQQDPVIAHGAVAALTLAVGSAAAYVTSTTFEPRYAAVLLPSFMLLTASGLSRFQGGIPRMVAVGSMVLLSLAGIVLVTTEQRTQADVVAATIEARGVPDALVVTCPDQLGPAVERALSGRDGDWEVLAYPRLDDPRFVDWTDYEERNARNSPADVAAEVLALAGDRTVFVVYNEGYRTLETQCLDLVNNLSSSRGVEGLVGQEPVDYFEDMDLVVFAP